MLQPRKWVPGLLPLGALVVIAAFWHQGSIELDLATRANTALTGAGLDWARADVSGRDSLVAGEAPSPEARVLAALTTDRVFGIRQVTDTMSVLPEARPFTFTALRDGTKITLTGAIPPGAARATLIEAARKSVPGASVVDEMRKARGAPPEFTALATYGLGELAMLGQGTVSISDLSLSLSGRAAGFTQYSDVRAHLASIPTGGKLAKGLAPGDILPPIVKPFVFSAERTRAAIVLSGYFPAGAAHERILSEARALGSPVQDQLRLADGAPTGDWAGAAGALTKALAKLETGKASLTDARASISGKARGLATEDDIRAELRALPNGYALAQVAVESSVVRPYRFEAVRNGDVLELSGFVPDEKARGAILDTARQYFEGIRIDDRLAVGLGEPQGYMAALQGGFRELSRLASGARFSLTDKLLALKGAALFDAARDQVSTEFQQALPAGFQAKAEVSTAPLPPAVTSLPECQMLYTDLLKRGTIQFKSGAAELSDVSRAMLDRLAVVSLRCVSARIEIGGHTDNDGSAQSNAELSRRRAETVGAYLVRAGVPVERLEPVGYGQTVPIAPNDSAENKAKNRRIEFFVK